TKQALLTNHKPEPHVRHLPSESSTLATPPIIYCFALASFSGWLPSFPACHWIAETRDWLRPGGPICLRPNPTPHYTATPVVHFTSVYWHSYAVKVI
uniref:Ubiquitin-like modifier-activating enzyme ATG7 n=1 Tax=Mesocestoides corti TaxID=53468 RepID=A0A5K3FGD2_MESCO